MLSCPPRQVRHSTGRIGGKVAIALVGAALIGLAIYFIHKAIINSQRATAYANAAEA